MVARRLIRTAGIAWVACAAVVPAYGAAPAAGAAEMRGGGPAAWPAQGSIRYRVRLGDAGFPVGEARHAWSHDGKRYRMQIELQTTGVAKMLRDLQYVQRSEGSVGPDGLRPDTFAVEQTRKTPSRVGFDWKKGVVTITRGQRVRTAAIRPGDQDLLSLWHHIAIAGVPGAPLGLTVVGGHHATPATVTPIGDETLQLPLGRVDTLRVRAKANDGQLSIDLWLAAAYHFLPLRVRIVDDKGEVLEQEALELTVPARAPANDPRSAADAPARTHIGNANQ